MGFSSGTLLNLQRLARVVKKESQITVSIRNGKGISDLLGHTVLESQTPAIIAAHNALVAKLTEQDKAELAIYNVPAFLESASVIGTAKSNEIKDPSQDRKMSYDRRQRSVHVGYDRRKKATTYRGVTSKVDRRQEDLPYSGPDRRGRGESQNKNLDENKTTHNKSDEPKGTRTGMYRGQKIDYDDEN
ncbi:MAG: hypothetical protein COA63_007990 [Methylophaga sp.]|nr:hypothetical protein [Methylophaga sp.]